MDDGALKVAASAAFNRLSTDTDGRQISGLLVAVSGGPDSMALLALLAAWVRDQTNPVVLRAATVDHGLRPDSAAEAELVSKFAAGLNIPHATLLWTGPKPAAGLQEAARNARYRLLADHARNLGLEHVMTAHHADDQAETVWMRLAAGSGLAGLGGMREQSVRDGILLLRPLLGVSKAALLRHCVQNGIPFVTDPSNIDERFGRARTRRLLPQLAEAGLSADRLVRLAARAARADAALQAVAETIMIAAALPRAGQEVQLNWQHVASQPEEIRLRVLLAALAVHTTAGTTNAGSNKAGDTTAVEMPRLENAERLLAEVDDAFAARKRLRRSQGARLVTVQGSGVVTIGTAPPRRTTS